MENSEEILNRTLKIQLQIAEGYLRMITRLFPGSILEMQAQLCVACLKIDIKELDLYGV